MADKISIENAKVGKDGVEMKTSSGGKEYAQFTAMWSSSRKDRQSGQREYGPTKFAKVMVFGFRAGDIAAGVRAGDRVNVSGTVEHFMWQSQNGPKDDWTIIADSVTLPVPRAQQGGQQGGFQPQQPQQGGFSGQQAQGDPWNSQLQGGFGGDEEQPPF